MEWENWLRDDGGRVGKAEQFWLLRDGIAAVMNVVQTYKVEHMQG